MMMSVDESTSAVRCTSYGDQILPAAFPLTLSLCVFFVRSVSPCKKMDTCNQGNQWTEGKLGRRPPTQQLVELDQHWARCPVRYMFALQIGLLLQTC